MRQNSGVLTARLDDVRQTSGFHSATAAQQLEHKFNAINLIYEQGSAYGAFPTVLQVEFWSFPSSSTSLNGQMFHVVVLTGLPGVHGRTNWFAGLW